MKTDINDKYHFNYQKALKLFKADYGLSGIKTGVSIMENVEQIGKELSPLIVACEQIEKTIKRIHILEENLIGNFDRILGIIPSELIEENKTNTPNCEYATLIETLYKLEITINSLEGISARSNQL